MFTLTKKVPEKPLLATETPSTFFVFLLVNCVCYADDFFYNSALSYFEEQTGKVLCNCSVDYLVLSALDR